MFSPAEPHTLFEAAQVVFRSDDYGRTWKVISPDLTRNDKSTEGPSGGDVYWDQTGAETFPDICVARLFAREQRHHVGRLGRRARSRHARRRRELERCDAASKWVRCGRGSRASSRRRPTQCTAFVTASRYMWDDMRPFIFKTTDCGANWAQMTNGIPSDQTVYAVRIDPREPRVMFAGTRSRVYVSLNGGQSWQSLALNLPPVEVRDIAINAPRRRSCDCNARPLVLGARSPAAGRGYRARISPSTSSAQVFAPETAWLTHAYGGGGFGPTGDNPDYGASVYLQYSRPITTDARR